VANHLHGKICPAKAASTPLGSADLESNLAACLTNHFLYLRIESSQGDMSFHTSSIFRVFIVSLVCLTSSCSTNSKLAAVQSIRGGRMHTLPIDRKEVLKDVKSEGRGKRILLVGLMAGAMVAGGALAGPSSSAFVSGATAGATTQMAQESVGGGMYVDSIEGRVSREVAFRERFNSSFIQRYTAVQNTALQNETRTRNSYSASSPYAVNTTVITVGADEKKNQHYLYVELKVEIVDAAGTVLADTYSYGESRGGALPAALTEEALLAPAVFEAHVKACAEYAAGYTAEVVADELGL
jgi:hypothetical protein